MAQIKKKGHNIDLTNVGVHKINKNGGDKNEL